MNLLEEFGKKTREYRESLSLTQEQLAELLDLQPETVSRIETGNTFVSAKVLEKMCKIFQVKFSDLFDFGNIVAEPENKKQKVINAELLDLDDGSLDFILTAIRAYKKTKKA